MYKELDSILHSQLRLATMSLLKKITAADFTFIKENTNATAGNLSVQLNKLKEAGYIEINKQFKDNYPHTICTITQKGSDAFDQYVQDLQQYIQVKSDGE
jgi:DNA-binding transcriptional ArsR family regulator